MIPPSFDENPAHEEARGVIIFDTSELWGIGVERGSTITPLRGVAGMTGHPLAIPEMVLREYLGSYRCDVAAARATIAIESSTYLTVSADGAWLVDLAGAAS